MVGTTFCIKTRQSDAGTRGFTLIELLIVVAIIAILAAIAVPNFLEAQTRAKVSRVQSDMRSVSTAFESYMVDNNQYPPSLARSPLAQPSPPNVSSIDTRLLTTPIAYITSLPLDAFSVPQGQQVVPNGGNNLVFYGSRMPEITYEKPFNSYIGYSIGPDQEYQTGGFRALGWIEEAESFELLNFSPSFPGTRYDPTNGTVSIGDIYRFGGGANNRDPLNP